MATSMTNHPAAPPPPAHKGDAGTALLVLAGLGAAGVGAWLFLHRKSTAAPPPAQAGQRFIAGSRNPSIPQPGLWIPCYGVVNPYPNQGVTTTIGPGPASSIPWGQPLAQTGPDYQSTWPVSGPHGGIVAGVADVIPTDYKNCYASLADITPAA